MSTADILQLGFDVLVFLAAVGIGRRRPWVPLIVFVWVAPYLGGNFIGAFYLPFSPARAIGFGIAVLAVTSRRVLPPDVEALRRRVYVFLGICVAAGIVGVCLVYFRANYIDQYLQTPLLRVMRTTGAEAERWLLLIAPITLAVREGLSRKLVLHAIYAGLFYCAMGLFQFGMEQAFNYDPFPIARESIGDSGPVSQSVIGSGLDTRINSLCGEPRYLSAYCCLWFLLTAALGKRVGLTVTGRFLIAITFLLCSVFTGSRTSLLILLTSGVVGGLAAMFARRMRLILPIFGTALLLALTFGTLIAMRVGSFGNRNNTSEKKDDSDTLLAVGSVRLPIEWQDVGGLSVMGREPWQLVFGMGPGLWQYYENPWDHQFVRTYFSDAAQRGIDSVKPNIQLVTRLCDVGVVGLYAMAAVLIVLYRHGRAGTPRSLRGEYLVSFAVLAAMLQVPGMADQLAFLMMGAAVQVYSELGAVSRKATDRMAARIWLKRPEYSPSPVGSV